MILGTLLEKLNYRVINGTENIEINNIVYDSRKVTEGDVFVCICGAEADGHKYIPDAVKKGCKAIVTEREIQISDEYKDTVFIVTDDTRLALAYMSAAFFDYPAEKLFTIGITGTKGKTTTTFMIREILESCGISTGLIGTVECIAGDERIVSERTTPESYTIHELFDKMVKAGCKCVVMEVSSQALMLHRTAGITFDIGVFTNLSADHIGPNEHSSFENYMECKGMLFKQCRIGIVNSDSSYTEGVLKGHTCTIEKYGLAKGADLRAENIKYSHEDGHTKTSYDVTGTMEMHVELNLPGEFSVYNSLCAIAVSGHFNVDEEILKKALLNVKVNGRVEPVRVSDKFTVMVDYAHNAMSLESLLKTLREYNPKRIVTLFGCGGNRSNTRRFEMGEISGRMSDFTIITSDNPRNENPEDIMNDIETGIRKTDGKYIKIADRREAVIYAVTHALPGDIVVIAGKGHEDYQEINGVKYHMSDRELVEEAGKLLDSKE